MRQCIFLIVALLTLTACDKNRVFEDYKTIKNAEWSYKDQPTFLIDIQDTTVGYTLYFNIRNNGNYLYNNLWVRMHIEEPSKPERTERFEFTLAEPDGRWLGTGIGDIYSNQILLQENIRFQRKGIYTIKWEQNMRDEPLIGIEDVGMRVEKYEAPEKE